LGKFEAKDGIAFLAIIVSFVLILVFRSEPQQAEKFKDVLIYIVIYYIGRKTEQIKT